MCVPSGVLSTKEQTQTEKGPSPREDLLSGLLFPIRELDWPNRAHRWAEHKTFLWIYKKESGGLSICGSSKPSTPCSPCTHQKGLHMTLQPNARYNITTRRMRHCFGAACKNQCDGLGQRSIVSKRERPGKPDAAQCSVSHRPRRCGPVILGQ